MATELGKRLRDAFMGRVRTELHPAVSGVVGSGADQWSKSVLGGGTSLGVDALTSKGSVVRVHLLRDGGKHPERWRSATQTMRVDGLTPFLAKPGMKRSTTVYLRFEWHPLSPDYTRDFDRALACARALVEFERSAVGALDVDGATAANLPSRNEIDLETPFGSSSGEVVPTTATPAVRRGDADQRLESVKAAIRAVLTAPGVIADHKKQVIHRLLWTATEEPWGKYTLPLRSEEALRVLHKRDLRHEHVVTRRSLAERIMADATSIDEVVATATACVVTKEEARRLDSKRSPARGLQGFARYAAVGIRLYQVDPRGAVTPYDPPKLS